MRHRPVSAFTSWKAMKIDPLAERCTTLHVLASVGWEPSQAALTKTCLAPGGRVGERQLSHTSMQPVFLYRI